MGAGQGQGQGQELGLLPLSAAADKESNVVGFSQSSVERGASAEPVGLQQALKRRIHTAYT